MRRVRRASLAEPGSPVLDFLILLFQLLLMTIVMKRPPTPSPAPSPAELSYEALSREDAAHAEDEALRRVARSRLPWADHFAGLPPLRGRVCLVIDESRSMMLDKISPSVGGAVAALLLNNLAITHLRVAFFAADVEQVVDWIELDAPLGATPEARAELESWLRDNLGASSDDACRLAQGRRLAVLRRILERLRAGPRGATNLIGAIADGIRSCSRLEAPGTVVLLSDGVHSYSNENLPENVAIQKLLDQELARITLDKAPTVHCVALIGESSWAGELRDPPHQPTKVPHPEEICEFLRSVAGRYDGVMLAVCVPPSTESAALTKIPDDKPRSEPSKQSEATSGDANQSNSALSRPRYDFYEYVVPKKQR